MNKFMQFLEGLSFFVFLALVFYVSANIETFSAIYGIPTFLVYLLCILGVIYIGYSYLKLYNKVNKLEYEFTSIVNHTFRTPLTGIMWFIKELEKDMPQKEKMLYLQNMTNATGKLLEIVDLFVGIKNIKNTSTYFFEAISIRDIVEKSIQKYREEINKKNLSFQVSTFRDVPLLTLDIKKISFVVDALIENAILYTQKDGKIIIECTPEKTEMILSVADNGMGISFIDMYRIFGRFFRSKKAVLMNPDGMGLKLYLSKQIIERHKGKIYAESRGEGQGSKFFIKLPYNK